ncbi:STT3 domain-containing protein, partial [Methanobacterium sp.]|uniref:STT3 domain-containing protein n=1 Tax=Methanobacterium sp. TaxID=2164 RepID=UPI003C710C85
MNITTKQITGLLWIIPGLVAFLIALIPTLIYPWPFTFDIFVHIQIAQVYSHYGFTLIDPLIDPPVGTPIAYPPLFSYLLLFLNSILKIDYFNVARLLQPIFAGSVVLSTSYVAKKYYGNIAGISAGFLIISSFLFGRLITPLPETMALIFVPLVVYAYY